MLALSSSALLGLVLLASSVEATNRVPLPSCEAGTRHIELASDAPNKPTEVCIRPHVFLNLFFDAKLASVDVEGRERFRKVAMADDALMLLASEALHDGERVPVTVYFEDGAAPMSASFVLVVHPSQAERQVEVSRHGSTRVSPRQARAEAQQYREDKALFQAERSGLGGLAGLISGGWLGEEGVVARVLENTPERLASPLEMQTVITYRAMGPGGKGRVAVEMQLSNMGTVAWTPLGAALVGFKGEALTGLTVTPLKPILPGETRRIVVELEVARHQVRGRFTLKLWAGDAEAEGVSLDGVTFP